MLLSSPSIDHGPDCRLPTRPLLRNCCPKHLAGLAIDERKTQRVRSLAESAQDPCALAGGVDVRAGVAIDDRAGEGAVDENGQLARRRGKGFGLADPDGQAPVERAQGGLASDQPEGGHAEHGGGAIGRRLGPRAEAPPTRDAVLRREGEPGGEVVFGGPPAEVGANLGDQLEGAVGGEAIDLGEVDAGEMVEDGPDIEVGFVAVPAGDPRGWQWCGGGRG